MSRVALDTNVLAYLSDLDRHSDDARKIVACRALLAQLLDRATIVIPVQVLGELYTVLTRSGRPRTQVRETVLKWAGAFKLSNSDGQGLRAALDLAAEHKLQFWDALILNAAAEGGCTMLLSEDMGHGFVWRGTVVINPLTDPMDDRLIQLLA